MTTGEVIALIKAFGGSGGGSSGGGVLVVHDADGTLDKTFKEIHDAFTNGALPVVIYNDMIWYPSSPPALSDLYLSFKAINLTTYNDIYYIYSREYIAESETSYPVLDA